MLPVGIKKDTVLYKLKLKCVLVIKHVKRNPIGNGVISIFSGQKPSVPD